VNLDFLIPNLQMLRGLYFQLVAVLGKSTAGLHQRRLNQLLDALRAELTGQAGVYHLHDVYLARLMDVVDLIRGAVRALR
jgi:hypothetical protein